MIKREPNREIAAGINIGFFNRDVMIDRRMRALISVLIGAAAPGRVRDHIEQENVTLGAVLRVHDIDVESVVLAAIDVHILHIERATGCLTAGTTRAVIGGDDAIGGAADRSTDDIAVLDPNIRHTIMIRSQLGYPNTARCCHIATHRHPFPARAMQESRC